MIVSFEEYNNKQKEVDNYKQTILNIIDDFIKWDEEFQKNHWSVDHFNKYQYAIDFYIDSQRRGDFVVKYAYKRFDFNTALNYDEVYFSHVEYLKLKEFMKDPEVYKSTKKYNL